MQKRISVSSIWRVISPILLHYVLAVGFQFGLGMFFPKLQQNENAMWLLTFANFCMLPVFAWMYRKDQPYREVRTHAVCEVGVVEVFWVIAGAVSISRGANLFIGLTPLPHLFPGYMEVSETIYGGSLLSQIAASVISASILEELLMRGLIYSRIMFAIGSVKLSMLASALIFGLFHGNVVQGVYAFVLGLFFVQVYERHGKLWLPILAHMAANAASILLEEFTWLNRMAESLTGYYVQTTVFLLAGAVCWKQMGLSDDT